MIRITVMSNMKRTTVFVDENDTLRKACEDSGVDYTKGMLCLDSAPLNPGDLNKTFAQMGYDGTPGKDSAYLSAVVKADNAA